MKTCLRLLSALTAIGVAVAAWIVYAGVYNIAATDQHTAPVYTLLDYAMRKSVKARVEDIKAPDLADPQRIRNGLIHYRGHCLQCHGAPGVSPDDLAFGMTPKPANLVATAREWPAVEIYWVVKHGIKMSGMPGWEYRMSDSEIWDVVAFVKHMPALSPAAYEDMSKRAGEGTHHHARPTAPEAPLAKADVQAGKKAIYQYLCATCHQIPGIVGATRHVGPPLNGIATRRYIGGVVRNTPENMVRFLQDPKQFDPLSAMPDLGVTERDARNMAAFLATLEDVE